MKVQSLSVVVPSKGCINECKFCVSRIHANDYEDKIFTGDKSLFSTSVNEYLARLNYARDNGCNSLMLTGNSEPQQNLGFLRIFGYMLRMMENPFHQIEMQTTGVKLDKETLIFLRDWVRVTTISLSVSSFKDTQNNEIINSLYPLPLELEKLCALIKELGFTLRLSINLTDVFTSYTVDALLNTAKNKYHADQITLRKMYEDGSDSPQAQWVRDHTKTIDYKRFEAIPEMGTFLRELEYGQSVYDIYGMSVVYDNDCMAKEPEGDELKYLILRPDCKLYSSWDSKASLIF